MTFGWSGRVYKLLIKKRVLLLCTLAAKWQRVHHLTETSLADPFFDSQPQLIRYRLQIRTGRWARGFESGPPQRPEPHKSRRSSTAIDRPSIMCHGAASPLPVPAELQFCLSQGHHTCWPPLSCLVIGGGRGDKGFVCLRALTRHCHFHLPVTHLVDVVTFLLSRVGEGSLAAH